MNKVLNSHSKTSISPTLDGTLSRLAFGLSTAMEPAEIITLFFQACQTLIGQPCVLDITNPQYQLPMLLADSPQPFQESFPVQNSKLSLGSILYTHKLDPAQRESLEIASSMVLHALENHSLHQQNFSLQDQVGNEKQKNSVLRSVAHDLRTPLTGIMGTAELICMESTQPNIRDMGQQIYEQASWLHELLENLLSLTRLEGKGLALEKQPQIVQDLLEEAVKRTSTLHHEQPILYHCDSDLILADADPNLIVQALVNLLDNALLHSSEKSPVELNLYKSDGEAVIEVADYGSGIAEEHLEQLFDAFFTTRAAETGHRKGTGLGLPIAKAIAEAHSGTLDVRNRPEGKGAIFTLRLPLSTFHA